MALHALMTAVFFMPALRLRKDDNSAWQALYSSANTSDWRWTHTFHPGFNILKHNRRTPIAPYNPRWHRFVTNFASIAL